MSAPRPGSALTVQEWTALWWAAQGYSLRPTGTRMHRSTSAVQDAWTRARRKLGARNLTHAVHLAHSRGLIGTYIDCGSRDAYVRHMHNDEVPDIMCRRANDEYLYHERRKGKGSWETVQRGS